MHKILTTFTFVLLTVAFSSSFANTDTTTISNFYQLKLEVEKLKFMQAQHKPNNYTPQIQALENQLKQLKNSFDANNTDVNRQLTHSKELIVRQDERIVDFNSHLFWSGILVTALLVLISVGGYFFSSIEAKKEIDKWLKENSEEKMEKYHKKMEGLIKDAEKLLGQPQKRTNAEGFDSTDEGTAIKKLAKQIKEDKSSSEYNFADFFTLHLDSYYQGNLKQSLEDVKEALKITPITDKQEAKALLHKGSILRELGGLGELDEAIETFDSIVEQFKDSTETTLLEQVAKALVNKGVVLDKLDKLDEVIETFDSIIEQFKDSTEITLLENVAMALVNKGVVLDKLDKPDKAIEPYDLVIERFKDSTETTLTLSEQVAMALVNKGVILNNKLNKPNEAIKTFKLVIKLFEGRTETTLSKQVAEAEKNKGMLEQNL